MSGRRIASRFDRRSPGFATLCSTASILSMLVFPSEQAWLFTDSLGFASTSAEHALELNTEMDFLRIREGMHFRQLSGEGMHFRQLSGEGMPKYNREVVLPDTMSTYLLYNFTMTPSSVLLIKTQSEAHILDPSTLFSDAYLPNEEMSDCDASRTVTWHELFPVLPYTFGLWNAVGPMYFFQFPAKNYIEPGTSPYFCFRVQDKRTHKWATFILGVNTASRSTTGFASIGTILLAL
ncbi:hypothetical protein TGP89_229220 [Toxoplasma gondii p89]|uniref:Uncharacterized protein n=1 Tax=Toxoplasma gondii p89 TaxID=943119 RepID=A0A086L203_TOXGO|nr:hypothetical protein TGP89_229220 [Toxoplasma gondii p89]